MYCIVWQKKNGERDLKVCETGDFLTLMWLMVSDALGYLSGYLRETLESREWCKKHAGASGVNALLLREVSGECSVWLADESNNHSLQPW